MAPLSSVLEGMHGLGFWCPLPVRLTKIPPNFNADSLYAIVCAFGSSVSLRGNDNDKKKIEG